MAVPVNPFAVTPITVHTSPLTRIVCPSVPAPERCCNSRKIGKDLGRAVPEIEVVRVRHAPIIRRCRCAAAVHADHLVGAVVQRFEQQPVHETEPVSYTHLT